jgi:dipeptidyl aminopeptidase/acylaminoacyl peptidase
MPKKFKPSEGPFMQRIFMLLSLGLLSGCGQPVTKKCDTQVPLIPRKVLFGNPEKTAPQISPDGKRLVYLAPVNGVLNVWVKTVGKNDDQPVSNDINRGIRSAWWAHNNKHVLYWQDKGGNENWHIFRIDPESKQVVDLTPFDNVRIFVYASSKKFPNELLIGMNKNNKLLFDVYWLNIETGKIEFIEKNPGNIEDWVADHNFKIRAARTMNEDGSVTLLTRNTIRDAWKEAVTWKLEDGLKVDCGGFTKDEGFSPDNKKLYLHDARKSNTAQFIEYDIVTGSEKVLVHDPLFDVDNLICDSENKPLAARINKERTYRVALDSEFEIHLKNILAIDDGDLYICNQSDDDRYWVVYFEHDNRSAAYYLYDKETQKSEFLFYPRPELNEYKLSEMEPISFTSRDGLKIHGYLTCPLGKQRQNLPLVLCVHGGPWGRDLWGYNPEVQWLTNRGYACLQVNYRGSGGYGKAFLNAGDREWSNKMHNDLIDAVNWAIVQDIADPKKIAIWGWSYGGYAALVGATFTPDVFCCAVDICGPCNLVTIIKSFMPYMVNLRKQFYLRVGDPEKDVDFLKSCSPLFKVDNIKIPILIGHGVNDVRVKLAEAEQIVAAMKAKGLPYEYVLFPDEGHGFTKPENRLKFYAIAEKFLAKHLGGRYEE